MNEHFNNKGKNDIMLNIDSIEATFQSKFGKLLCRVKGNNFEFKTDLENKSSMNPRWKNLN